MKVKRIQQLRAELEDLKALLFSSNGAIESSLHRRIFGKRLMIDALEKSYI